MATWQTDVLGTGLAHAQPTRAELLLARRTATRWKAWQPLLLHELRQRPREPGFVAREMLRLERNHARVMAELFSGLNQRSQWSRMSRINTMRIDDPRWTDEERAYRMAHRGHAPKPPQVKRPRGRPRKVVVEPEPPQRWVNKVVLTEPPVRKARKVKIARPVAPPPHPPELSCAEFVRLRSEEDDDEVRG